MKRVQVSITSYNAQREGRVKDDQALFDVMRSAVFQRIDWEITNVVSDSLIALCGTTGAVQVPNNNWGHFTAGWDRIKNAIYGRHDLWHEI
jgi:hypothetical protein